VTDHGDGTYTATLTSTEVGLASVFATLDGQAIANDATVSFSGPPVVGPASAAHSTIAAAPATVTADGTSSATITVQARDAADTPETAGGAAVALATTRGTLSAVRDDGDGTYTATLTSSQAGVAVVTATLDGAGVTGSASVTFSAVPSIPPAATPPLGPPAPMPTSTPRHGSRVTRISKIAVRPHSIGVCRGCTYPRATVSFTLSRAAKVRVLVQARRHGHWTTIRTIAIKAHAGTGHHTLKGHWAGTLTAGAHRRVLVQLRHGPRWVTQKTLTLKARGR
jgi:adhesin/invasin